jgi:transcriptional regulator with GAF, ATPase, and Fis domain
LVLYTNVVPPYIVGPANSGEKMKPRPKDALKECLSRIFRSEDLKTSIRTLYSYFQTYFPLDFITILIYDAESHTVKYRVHSTDVGTVLVDELIRFSEDTKEDAHGIIDRNPRTLYIPNGQKHPLVKQFDSYVGIDQPASMIMHFLEIAHQEYINLSLVLWGEDRYHQKNIRLMDTLSEMVDNALSHIYSQMIIADLRERLASENRKLRRRMPHIAAEGTVGLSDLMLSIKKVAKLDTTVLLMGETGVGKELIANTIHQFSSRSKGPLVSINCGALTETLLDSELFGHEKGAFTGASTVKKGVFEQADGGSIFLDEVSELSLHAQVKLLRVLQSMTFQRVGGQRTISVDVRVIAATNRDIAKMVDNHEFRKDLWFRLSTFPITIPSLRERTVDIPILAEYFANRLSVEMNLSYRYRFASHAMEQLQRYGWPGNVRELENVIERALIVSRGAPLSFNELGSNVLERVSSSLDCGDEEVLTMSEIASRHIMNVLRITHGRIEGKGGAAERLDLKPSTLRARMKKLGIRITKVPDNILTTLK